MRILAVEVVGAGVPASVVQNVRALFQRTDEVEVRRPSEVLLPMRVVTLGPLVFLVYNRAEACLVRVDHEFFEAHCFLVLVQVHGELPLCHQITHRAALFRGERQWIYLLLLLLDEQGFYVFCSLLRG